MAEEDKKFSKQLIGKTVVSKTGKRFGEVGDIIFETRSGELIHIILKNPTSYTQKLELEKDKENNILIPYSAVMAEKEDYAIWTEKYRPQDFSEIKGQKEIVARVKAFVAQKNMPHQLYSGPAGIGKSTLAIVAAKKLFGEQWRQNLLELNASDERGIDIVRVKVKDFARTKAIGDAPFKIIYLDECDALT